MRIFDKNYKTIWEDYSSGLLELKVIDQTKLPFSFEIKSISSYQSMVAAIKEMVVRGAPLIGIAGAYAMCLAMQTIAQNRGDQQAIFQIAEEVSSARPTAVNLKWAVDKVIANIGTDRSASENFTSALEITREICESELKACRLIGEHGGALIEELSLKKNSETVNILTHCNAGWLATLDYGTALAPIYAAAQKGINLHVWVDETRPRNQGSKLTAFELLHEHIPHTVIVDNLGGHLMQHGLVDMVIVGSDRTTACCDVCNKVGTYLKALAAHDNGVPFYAALPTSSIDTSICDGINQIEIEERASEEVIYFDGEEDGRIRAVRAVPIGSKILNYGFDVTPARLVTSLITENGVFDASESGIKQALNAV